MKNIFLLIILMTSCNSEKNIRENLVGPFWILEDAILNDSLYFGELIEMNMLKFYDHGICILPDFVDEAPNSNNESVKYLLFKESGYRLFFETDNSWFNDTFDIEFSSRKQGMFKFIELHLRSDSLYYKLSRMK